MKKFILGAWLFLQLWPGAALAQIDPAAENGFTATIKAGSGDDFDLSNGSYQSTTGPANKAVIYATDGGNIFMNGGSLLMNTTSNIGAATAGTDGTIELNNVSIQAGDGIGNYQSGLQAINNGNILFENGTIETYGEYGMGVLSNSDGLVTVNNSTINTSGAGAAGVNVGRAGRVNLNDTAITTTSANEGNGIFAIYGGQATMTNGSITVNSVGVFARRVTIPTQPAGTASTVILNNVTIKTEGTNLSIGLRSWEEESHIIMTGGSITTEGSNSYAAWAQAATGSDPGGTVTLKDVDIMTTGSSSHGLYIGDRSFGVLNGGRINVNTAQNSYAVYTLGTGDVSGNGVYDITGDILNAADGTIALDFQANSRFKGGSDIGSGTIDFTMPTRPGSWTRIRLSPAWT